MHKECFLQVTRKQCSGFTPGCARRIAPCRAQGTIIWGSGDLICIQEKCSFCSALLFWGHTPIFSDLITPGFVLKCQLLADLVDHMWYWNLNLGLLHARQIPYPLCCLWSYLLALCPVRILEGISQLFVLRPFQSIFIEIHLVKFGGNNLKQCFATAFVVSWPCFLLVTSHHHLVS